MNEPLMSNGEQQASEEEQAAYEYLSTQALDFIHDEKSANFVKNKIGSAENPLSGVAEVAAIILHRLEAQNQDNGGVPDAVKMEVAEDIADELLNLVFQAGLMQESEFTQNEEQYIEQITNEAYKKYMEIKEQSGELNPEEEKANLMDTVNSQEAKQGIGAMSNAAAEQLNKMFGGQNG